MINKVIEIIEQELDTEDKVITENTRLEEDLGADSLDKAELLIAMQENFNVDIDENSVKGIKTVKDIVEFIEKNGK